MGNRGTTLNVGKDVVALKHQLQENAANIQDLSVLNQALPVEAIREMFRKQPAEMKTFTHECINQLKNFATKTAHLPAEIAIVNVYLRCLTLVVPILHEVASHKALLIDGRKSLRRTRRTSYGTPQTNKTTLR